MCMYFCSSALLRAYVFDVWPLPMACMPIIVADASCVIVCSRLKQSQLSVLTKKSAQCTASSALCGLKYLFGNYGERFVS